MPLISDELSENPSFKKVGVTTPDVLDHKSLLQDSKTAFKPCKTFMKYGTIRLF